MEEVGREIVATETKDENSGFREIIDELFA